MGRAHAWVGLVVLVVGCVLAPLAGADVDRAALPIVAYQPGGPAYWDRPQFANALLAGGHWSVDWSGIPYWDHPQFDPNGYPLSLESGQELQAAINGLHMGYGDAPAGWPDLVGLMRGHVVLTWQGNADIRLDGGTCSYLTSESSGDQTGLLVNGRRVYRCSSQAGWIQVVGMAGPISDIKVWLPDPANPQNASLENRLFHPTFLARIAEAPWGFIRLMDWGATNASPVQDWTDRRRPSHIFATGVINPRPPAAGYDGERETGVPYEYMVALANETGKDLWITVPHLATDDFLTRLAQLIRYGSDGANPYTSPVTSPVWPPLAPERKVFVEYSNEIWSWGNAFAQGEWAYDQSLLLGISKPQFNARRFCQVWRTFQQVFGGSSRIVRAAAVFTAMESYTSEFLQEIRSYGPTLSPPVEPDIIAPTTYFGNGIQDWAHERAIAMAGTADPWFYTTQTFDAGGGVMRPVSLPPSDPYWTSGAFARHKEETLAEWRKRILAGSAAEGGGPDATGLGGGFDVWLADLARTLFATPKPLVAYEGGPSLYTDYMDGGEPQDDGITWFTSAINREQGIRAIYDAHLNMARSKGLWTHSAFVDCSAWSKWGQWGHLEFLDQPLAQAPKYSFLLDHIAEMSALRHVDNPAAAVPSFATPPTLPFATYGQPYSVDITAAGGNGALHAKVILSSLVPGLVAEVPPGSPGTVRLHGTPQASGMGYVYARVADADGDPTWRVFSLYCAGGPGALVDSDFRGTAPGTHTPWTATYYRAADVTSYSGWRLGTGSAGRDGDDRLVWSEDMPSEPSTLAQAVAESQYVTMALGSSRPSGVGLRRGRVRFSINRIDYHAPRQYAVLTSVGGFAAGQEVFTTPHFEEQNEPRDFAFDLPDLPAYDAATSIEMRIYGFAGQWGGHRTSLSAFSMARLASVASRLSIGDVSVAEGNGGTKSVTFTVTRSED